LKATFDRLWKTIKKDIRYIRNTKHKDQVRGKLRKDFEHFLSKLTDVNGINAKYRNFDDQIKLEMNSIKQTCGSNQSGLGRPLETYEEGLESTDECRKKFLEFYRRQETGLFDFLSKNPIEYKDEMNALDNHPKKFHGSVRQSTAKGQYAYDDNLFDTMIRNNENINTTSVEKVEGSEADNLLKGMKDNTKDITTAHYGMKNAQALDWFNKTLSESGLIKKEERLKDVIVTKPDILSGLLSPIVERISKDTADLEKHQTDLEDYILRENIQEDNIQIFDDDLEDFGAFKTDIKKTEKDRKLSGKFRGIIDILERRKAGDKAQDEVMAGDDTAFIFSLI